MKGFLTLAIAAMLSCGTLLANSEVIHLKNGSQIKGEVVEQVPGKTMTIHTSDGSVIVVNYDDVERIVKAQSTEPVSVEIPSGLGFGIALGPVFPTESHSSTGFAANLLVDKRFSSNFSAGIGAGVYQPGGSGAKPSIPVFADFKAFAPLKSTKILPFLDIKGGYQFATNSGGLDFVNISVMPGARFPVSPRMDVDFSIGYEHFFAAKGSGGNGAIGCRIGLSFHKSTVKQSIKEKKEKKVVPTRNNGAEIGFEITPWELVGGNILLGYKCNPHLSVALGVGYGKFTAKNKPFYQTRYSLPDGKGDVVGMDETPGNEDGCFNGAFFIRGEYRLNDSRFSPIGRIDLGYNALRCLDNSGMIYTIMDYQTGHKEYIRGNQGKDDFFIRPAVGISWRVTNNSYLEAAIGYEFCKGVPKTDITINENKGTYQSITFNQDALNINRFSVSVTWKRTLKLFSKH